MIVFMLFLIACPFGLWSFDVYLSEGPCSLRCRWGHNVSGLLGRLGLFFVGAVEGDIGVEPEA